MRKLTSWNIARGAAIITFGLAVFSLGTPSAQSSGAQTSGARAQSSESDQRGTDKSKTVTPKIITIGAGPPFGFYFATAGSVCRAAQGPNLRCNVETNANSIETLKALRSGRLDFALVQSDWLVHAANGSGVFKEAGPDTDLRTVLSLHGEALSVLVRNDTIKTLSDLQGKRINLGPPSTYHRMFLGMLLRELKLKRGDFSTVLEAGAEAQEKAFCAGDLDIAVVVSAHPSPIVAALIERCGARLLPISGAVAKKIAASRAAVTRVIIPGAAYGGVSVESFGVRAVLVSRKNVKPGLVAQVFNAVTRDFDGFKKSHPAFSVLDITTVTKKIKGMGVHNESQALK
ncbi:MAG: TAXI family TRAP transporter solute-binding subunit [Alphaproteobacteria bacterium]